MSRIKRKSATEKVMQQQCTPIREAENLLINAGVTPKPSLVQNIVPYTATMKAIRNAPMSVKRKLLSQTTPRKSSKGFARAVGAVSKVPRKYIFHSTKAAIHQRKVLSSSRKAIVVSFLKRPDNSSQLPGKKDQVRGQARYGLTDTMSNLYTKFRYEYSMLQISKAVFFRARPAYIKLVQWTNRKQCLCQKCANMSLRIDVVKALPKSGQAVNDMAEEEIEATLKTLPPNITFKQWRKVDIVFTGKLIKKQNVSL